MSAADGIENAFLDAEAPDRRHGVNVKDEFHQIVAAFCYGALYVAAQCHAVD